MYARDRLDGVIAHHLFTSRDFSLVDFARTGIKLALEREREREYVIRLEFATGHHKPLSSVGWQCVCVRARASQWWRDLMANIHDLTASKDGSLNDAREFYLTLAWKRCITNPSCRATVTGLHCSGQLTSITCDPNAFLGIRQATRLEMINEIGQL